jgi:outer membrane protein W
VIRRAHHIVAVLCLLSITAVSAPAQSWEAGGLAGFTPAVSLEHKAPELSDLRIRGGLTWGLGAMRFFTPNWGAELMWTQQTSALQAETPDGTADFYRMSLGQLQANVVYQFGDASARWRPFVFGGAGATFFTARDLDSATKASFGLGGGIKYFPWGTVGLRGQFRYKPTSLNDDLEGGPCSPFGFCQGALRQIDIGGGVIIRF